MVTVPCVNYGLAFHDRYASCLVERGLSVVGFEEHMGKTHKNCIIGQKFCLHHITGTAFIIRLKFNVYIVENSDTFQKIYSFMQFK